MLNENGFRQITEDHSLVNAFVQSGQISKDDASAPSSKKYCTKSFRYGYKQNQHLNKAIILESVDRFLLCTDGLTDKLEDKELLEIIEQSENNESKQDKQLIDLANSRGGEDNISLILATLGSPTTREGESV